AYQRTHQAQFLTDAIRVGDAIVHQFNALTSADMPYTPDIEFLVQLSQLTGNNTYRSVAASWFQILETRYNHDPAFNVDQCPADNEHAFDYTMAGEGSLLWAIHALPGAQSQIDEYRTFLLANQDAVGTWDGGDLQQTAYIVLGLAAVGGAQAEAAIRSAAAMF